ncbi:GGDEF domain-containing protein [Euzebya sp.]|uniref:GGDEF domain-containing protein n=1 Tax=Euzebya sp. TaxID=1971409 RepID=UPI00351633B9
MIDRRDELRRRIYLLCLAIGLPVLAASWIVEQGDDPVIAILYPPHIAVQLVVAIGLLRRRMGVRTAERVVLVGVVVTYLVVVAGGMIRAADLAGVREEMSAESLLAITLMMMLAYVAFETDRALRLALAIVAAYVGILAARLAPDAIAGRLPADAVDFLPPIIALVAAVGLLHVLAQTKEQAAEARSHAETMTALAHTDVLTQLPNRRHLHAELESQLAEAQDEDAPLAVILLDIDHFKRINDSHGHEAGDAVLREVAQVLGTTVRHTDLLGRWGGEEFLVVAPTTAMGDAVALAERCRMALASTMFPAVGRVTASMGVATHEPGDSAWGLLRRADAALYLAKGGGRDQVRGHEDRDPDVDVDLEPDLTP